MEITTPVTFIINQAKKFPNKQFQKESSDQFVASQLINSYKQIDLVSTLSCLFDLPVPKQNKGLMFINDLIDSDLLARTKEKKLLLYVKAMKCLNENFLQLDNEHHLIDTQPELVDNVTSLNREFIELFKKHRLSNDPRYMFEITVLARRLENFLRNNANLDKNEHKNNKTQIYFLIIAMVAMLVVNENFIFQKYYLYE